MTFPQTILLVDDDVDILDQLGLTLTRAGYQVVRAENSREAEAALLNRRPDAVICDLMMDELDSGFLVCHEVKKLYPETPVILLTAVTANTGLDFAPRSAGARSWIKADRFLHKPVRPAELRLAIEQLLRTPAPAQDGAAGSAADAAEH